MKAIIVFDIGATEKGKKFVTKMFMLEWTEHDWPGRLMLLQILAILIEHKKFHSNWLW